MTKRQGLFLLVSFAVLAFGACEAGGGPAGTGDAQVEEVAGDVPASLCAPAVCEDAGACDAVSPSEGQACGAGPCGSSLVCKAGECVLDGLVCDDSDPCTQDTCDPETGCAHAPWTGGEISCGTGECATVEAQCIAGKLQVCVPGEPSAEICDGKDNDCNGTTDDGIADLSCGNGVCAVSVPGCVDGAVPACLPDATKVAAESCNGQDDDCNGTIDDSGSPGCQPYLKDVDKDGQSSSATEYQCLCAPAEPYTALVDGDCDDADPAIHEGATESCNGKDDDCNGQTDEGAAQGCTPHYGDADEDGYGDPAVTACLCAPDATFTANQAGDCDDTDAAVNPGAAEACNGYDDDCNGGTDEEGAEGCVKYYVDADKDGWGVSSDTDFHCLCKGAETIGTYTASKGGDCCDKDARAHPGQTGWFGTVGYCDSWDFDCDKIATKEVPNGGACDMELVTCNVSKAGWSGAIPDCGVAGQYLTDCTYNWGVCDKTTTTRTQLCR